jgi:hypothetical protein
MKSKRRWIRLGKMTYTNVPEEEIYDAVEELAKENAGYKGDPIDDIQEYRHSELGKAERIIYVMTPIGDYLFFNVTQDKNGNYTVALKAAGLRVTKLS